jgi:hypothetical protein
MLASCNKHCLRLSRIVCATVTSSSRNDHLRMSWRQAQTVGFTSPPGVSTLARPDVAGVVMLLLRRCYGGGDSVCCQRHRLPHQLQLAAARPAPSAALQHLCWRLQSCPCMPAVSTLHGGICTEGLREWQLQCTRQDWPQCKLVVCITLGYSPAAQRAARSAECDGWWRAKPCGAEPLVGSDERAAGVGQCCQAGGPRAVTGEPTRVCTCMDMQCRDSRGCGFLELQAGL